MREDGEKKICVVCGKIDDIMLITYYNQRFKGDIFFCCSEKCRKKYEKELLSRLKKTI